MTDIVERADGGARGERLRGKPRGDCLPIRVRRLKAISGDDVRVGDLAIGQQQTASVEKLASQRVE